jgi:acyl-CoA synthetase (AMP-forming)/AMP-acid ligase II
MDRFSEVHDTWAPRELTDRELWHWRAESTPERKFLWDRGQSFSYGEFDGRVQRLASGLRELGVGAGTRVLVGMSTRFETVVAQLAIAQLGGVRVLLVPGMPLEELLFPIAHSEARIMVADDPVASQVMERRAECPSIDQLVVLGDGAAGPGVVQFDQLAESDPLAFAPLRSDDLQALSYIVYTSGSTGRPKGVMLKAASLYFCGLGYADLYGFHAEDNYFLPLTFGHSLASVAGLGIPMVTGGSVSLVERFRPSKFWGQVADCGATVSVLFPAHLNLLLEADDGATARGSSSLRFVVTHSYLPAFVERFGVELGTVWGMTETLGCVGSDPGYGGELGPGYVGHAFTHGEVGIFDEDFNRVGAYRYGELCYRHPMAMIGYLNDAEATAATLRDGWVRSGDRGYVDHSGRAYFAGRYKAMIKRSGENVSAEEVEAALLEHPDVAECVVVAVPDRIRTEEVGAIVVRRAGTDADPVGVREAAAQRLIRWKLPRYIVIREDPLPRLGNGKLDRTGAAATIDPALAWDADKQLTA